jgi:hypothetical protein
MENGSTKNIKKQETKRLRRRKEEEKQKKGKEKQPIIFQHYRRQTTDDSIQDVPEVPGSSFMFRLVPFQGATCHLPLHLSGSQLTAVSFLPLAYIEQQSSISISRNVFYCILLIDRFTGPQ